MNNDPLLPPMNEAVAETNYRKQMKDEIVQSVQTKGKHAMTIAQRVDTLLKFNGFGYRTVTGSVALYALGMPLTRPVGDIDVIVPYGHEECLSREETDRVLKMLQDTTFNDELKDYTDSRKVYIFKTKDSFKVNVFPVDWGTYSAIPKVKRDGIEYATVFHVLTEKMKLRRAKDCEDILSMVNAMTLLAHEETFK